MKVVKVVNKKIKRNGRRWSCWKGGPCGEEKYKINYLCNSSST
jgi:hypothetical protein